MRIAYALTAAVLVIGSAASLSRSPAAQTAAPAAEPAGQRAPQNPPTGVPGVGPGGAPASFADLTERLQPAVVNVSTTTQVEVGRFPPMIGPGMPLDEFFRRFQEGLGPGQSVTREATSLGSGFLISPDGYIVTNNHVITGVNAESPVDKISVTLSDRREFQARIVGRDQLSDLALLKIDSGNLPYVRFGDSTRVRVGDWVIAIGNPFGLGGTVTAGIVSALHRNIQAGQYDRFIQTDASINQGNSGGPLFDLQGNVVGINSAIYSPSGGNVGVGFAIPAEQARPVIAQLRETGKVRRGYLGVGVQPLTEDVAAGLGLPKDRGEIVADTVPNGPAARAGIRPGDVVTRVAGQEVTVENTLSYIVANAPIDSTVPIEIIRNGRRQTVQVRVAERPSEELLAAAGDRPNASTPQQGDRQQQAARLGITLQALDPNIRRQLGVGPEVQGVVIAAVNPASDAARKGLQRGDIIRRINDVQTTTPQQAAAAVELARRAGRDTVLVYAQRGSSPPRYLGLKLMPAADSQGG